MHVAAVTKDIVITQVAGLKGGRLTIAEFQVLSGVKKEDVLESRPFNIEELSKLSGKNCNNEKFWVKALQRIRPYTAAYFEFVEKHLEVEYEKKYRFDKKIMSLVL